MGAPIAAAVLVVLGATPYELGVRAEARGAQDGTGDFQLDPMAAIEYRSRDLQLLGRYDPELLVRRVGSRGTFDATQRAAGVGTWRLDRDTHIGLRQDFSYGATSLSWLALAPDTAPTSIVRSADAAPVDMLNETSTLWLGHAVTRQLLVTARAGVAVTGGIGDFEAAYPRTTLAQAELSVSWLDRRDMLSLSIGGRRGWISNDGGVTSELDGFASWRHALNGASAEALRVEPWTGLANRAEPRYEAELATGVALLGGDSKQRHEAVPRAGAFIRRDDAPARGSWSGRVGLQYAPTLDGATGQLVPRLEGTCRVEYRVLRPMTVFTAGGAAWAPSPPPSQASRVGQGAVGIRYEPIDTVAFSVAVRAAALPGTEWGAVLTATVSQRARL